MGQLGKYSIVRRLGVGGMAEVYLCKLVGIGGFEKHVVVKKIRADIEADPEFVTMFFDEARLAANLSHPNIVHVFEVDQIDGAPYLAMEYVRGATLSRVLQKLRANRTTMDIGHLAYIFAGVCAGLDHAHNARDSSGRPLDIVHRDVSPQNIIVSFEGTPKIFDFGVAKARGSMTVTAADRVKGKFAYMAPEQLRAKPVDAKADVYAVGVCMYEAVTGRRPFVGKSEGELLVARAEGRFTMPSELVPSIPVQLEHLILSAMASDPADRPSALELQQALSAFYAVGSDHPSSALAVAAWLKELFPEEVTESYESYSSAAHPSVTSLPRSAKLPPTSSAVELRPRMVTPRVALVAGAVLAAVTVTVVLATGAREGERERAASTAAQPAAGARATPATVALVPDPRIAEVQQAQQELEEKHRRELEQIRRELEKAKREEARAKEVATEPTKREEADRKKKPLPPPRVATVAKPAASARAGAGEVRPPIDAGVEPAAKPDGTESAHVVARSVPPAAASGSAVAAPRITAAPAPSVAVARPKPHPGALDAKPWLSQLTVDGSLTTTEVETAIARTFELLRACYREAARRVSSTPDVSIRVRFEIDEGARASGVRVSGDALGLGACAKDALGSVRTRVAPDVGTVSVSAVIRFKPVR